MPAILTPTASPVAAFLTDKQALRIVATGMKERLTVRSIAVSGIRRLEFQYFESEAGHKVGSQDVGDEGELDLLSAA